MSEALHLRIWIGECIGTAALEGLLLFCLLRRPHLYRTHLVFAIYIVAALLQTILGMGAYFFWGLYSVKYFNFAWGSQVVVLGARWFAVAEITRRVLAPYAGIWKLARTTLFILGIGVLIFAFTLSNRRPELSVLIADRGVELSLAVFIAGMFVFARYYRLPVTNLDRQLAIGFCLYSCSWVFANTMYELLHSTSWARWDWDFFQALSFFASLIVWIMAVREPVAVQATVRPVAVTSGQYLELAEGVDARLRLLDDRLRTLLDSQDDRL
jgi:hypothetical protein